MIYIQMHEVFGNAMMKRRHLAICSIQLWNIYCNIYMIWTKYVFVSYDSYSVDHRLISGTPVSIVIRRQANA